MTGEPQHRLWTPWRGLKKDEQRLLASCLLMVVEQDQPGEQTGGLRGLLWAQGWRGPEAGGRVGLSSGPQPGDAESDRG